ncbi:MAG: hypothetical protein NVS9B13_12620 [Candidatus Acidiferrum sp.]
MAFAGFAEENGFDAAAGAKRFLHQPGALDTDASGLGGQTAAQGHAELLEPAILATRE